MIDLKIGIRGRYKLAVKKNGGSIRESGWFDNLITNQGMNFLTTVATYSNYCQVGASSTAPAFTDVGLGSRIAGKDNFSNFSVTFDTTNRYAILSKMYSFPTGAAAGNIAEVGVGTAASGNVLFSRALILDSSGNPTTITVLPDEDLVVIYQLWIKQPTADFTSVVGAQTITIRSSSVTSSSTIGWSGSHLQFVGRVNYNAYTGAIGAITAAPSGTSAAGTSITNDAYVADSWTRVSRITWGTDVANFAILSFTWGFGPTFWQAQLSSAITKTSTQTFRLGVRLTWSRDSGPA